MTEEIFGPLLPIITVKCNAPPHFSYLKTTVHLNCVAMFCTVDKHSRQHWVHKLEAETSCPLCIHQKWSIQAADFDRNIVRKFDLQRCHASGDVLFSFWCILFFGIREGKWSTSRILSIQNDLGLAIFNYVALIVAWDYDFWHFIVHPLNTTKWNSKVSNAFLLQALLLLLLMITWLLQTPHERNDDAMHAEGRVSVGYRLIQGHISWRIFKWENTYLKIFHVETCQNPLKSRKYRQRPHRTKFFSRWKIYIYRVFLLYSAVCLWFVTVWRSGAKRFREVPRKVLVRYVQPRKGSSAQKLLHRTGGPVSSMEWLQVAVPQIWLQVWLLETCPALDGP